MRKGTNDTHLWGCRIPLWEREILFSLLTIYILPVFFIIAVILGGKKNTFFFSVIRKKKGKKGNTLFLQMFNEVWFYCTMPVLSQLVGGSGKDVSVSIIQRSSCGRRLAVLPCLSYVYHDCIQPQFCSLLICKSVFKKKKPASPSLNIWTCNLAHLADIFFHRSIIALLNDTRFVGQIECNVITI